MNVSLTPQLEALVQRKVESGLYGSASEVMRKLYACSKSVTASAACALKHCGRKSNKA